MRKAQQTALALFFCLALGACSSQIDDISPSFETLQVLREKAIPAIALGNFSPGPENIGRSVVIRASNMHAPKGHNFAEFLGTVFETELRAAGKLDPASALRLDGILTESQVSENITKGNASLAARITLSRSGNAFFSKPYRVSISWKSDFIGGIAIPEAFRQYNSLYALLVRQIFADPEFLSAARK